MKKLNQNGFTLIELMIVVVIIGILAAIAIPQFLKYQLKSKTSESSRNLGAIRTNQEAFYAKWNSYVYSTPYPRAGATTDGNKEPWPPITGASTTGLGFGLMGFASQGAVYFSYSVPDAVQSPSGALGVTCALTEGATDSTIDSTNPLSPVVSPAVPRDTANPPADVVTPMAIGNVDGDAIFVCYLTGNETTNIVADPADASENVF